MTSSLGDFTIDVIEGDKSSRAIKPMAKLRAKIVGKKSAWAYYMAFHYTQEGATRENCAEWWKALEPSDKAKFEAQAAADRERFEKLIIIYQRHTIWLI